MKNDLSLNLSYDYLQEIRLAHAIAETGFNLFIARGQRVRFQRLEQVFSVSFPEQKESVPRIDDIEIRHKGQVPHTRIGEISRSLIWPHAVLRHCRSLWQDDRPLDYCFLGLVTSPRKRWLANILGQKVPGFFKGLKKLKLQVTLNNILAQLGYPTGRILITATTRGRTFPGKSWDEEYYAIMASSKFILCPSGDAGCPWTYRFFEAMLCGAIPVVETVTSVYSPFYFLSQEDKAADFVYRKEIALANYELCKQLLTVPHKDFTEELRRLIALKESVNA